MSERLTRRQAAIIGLYTGVLCGPFADVQALGDELSGGPTWTHQYGDERFVEAVKAKAKPLFLEICAGGDE